MKNSWIHQENKQQLLLFFNGWGCDEHQFKYLGHQNCDVLMVNDYRELKLPEEVIQAINNYSQVHVVAWSFGVWVAQKVLSPYENKINNAIAINGTLEPVSARYGIPEEIVLGTLENLSERNLLKFQRRMVKTPEGWKRFQQTAPQRDIIEQKEELRQLVNHFNSHQLSENIYSTAINCSNDLIFPFANQENFWKERAEVVSLEEAHFCFYGFQS